MSRNKLADLEALLYAASRPIGLTDIVTRLRLENEREAADLIKKALGLEKGSGTAGHEELATLSRQKLREIAELKAKDLSAVSIEGAERVIEGTARSMGIEIE